MPTVHIPPEIQDLVDNPRETLDIELKEWLDFSQPLNRANAARHICALANHGGGYLILGICDDLSPSSEHPGDLSAFSRDRFAGIVDKYLTPTFQCDVFFVARTAGGHECVVVRVPSHGAVPICARTNGPNDERGKVQAIREGNHYIRLPGPKSEAIKTPEQWKPVIHRCVLSERQSLLESIGRILRTDGISQRPQGAALQDFHDAFGKKFKDLL